MRTSCLAGLVLALSIGCGGGGGGGSVGGGDDAGGLPPIQGTAIFVQTVEDDGTQTNQNRYWTTLCVVIGDIDCDNSYGAGPADPIVARGYYRFPLGAVPPGSEIVSARLWLYQSEVNGTPFVNHGNVIVEQTLNGADSLLPGGGTRVDPPLGTLSSTEDLGYRSVDATSAVRLALQNPAIENQVSVYRVDFCVRFDGVESDTDGFCDNVVFSSLENTSCAEIEGQAVLDVVWR